MLFKKIRGVFSDGLSVDLGSVNTLILIPGQGIVLNEPSIIAFKENKAGGAKSIAAVGTDAKRIVGRAPGDITVTHPVKAGVIADYAAARLMLRQFMEKVHKNRIWRPNPRIAICAPSGSTQVERRAIRESVVMAGARDVFLIEKAMAAAIGAGLPVHETYGSMVLDIGGGTSEVAVISINGIVYSSSVRMGGTGFDEAIIHYVRRHYGTLIGEPTAEKIKMEIGTAYPDGEFREIEVTGHHLAGGAPHNLILNSQEIREALREPLSAIVGIVKGALERTPPELSGDISNHGICLTGGGALLKGIDRLVADETGLPVFIADNPLTCAACGGGTVLEMMGRTGDSDFFLGMTAAPALIR